MYNISISCSVFLINFLHEQNVVVCKASLEENVQAIIIITLKNTIVSLHFFSVHI